MQKYKTKSSVETAHNAMLILFGISSIATGLFSVFVQKGSWRGIGGLASVLAIPLLPYIRKLLRFKKSYLMEMVLLGFTIIAFHIGVVLDIYNSIWFYDNVLHFLSGFIFAMVGVCIFLLMREDKSTYIYKDPFLVSVFAFSFAQLSAVTWEIYEYVSFLITRHDSQHHLTTGVSDTMEDLMACFLGALIFSVIVYSSFKKERSNSIIKPVEEFYEINCVDV